MSNMNISERATVEFDPIEPLAPVRSETKKANEALRDYARMGPARSLRKLHARYTQQKLSGDITIPPTLSLYTLGNWSMRFGWPARAEAFDILERRANDELWKERREKIRELDFSFSDKLRDLAEKIISEGPSFIRTSRRRIKGDPEKGKPDTIVVTMALDGALMISALETASKLQRRAAGLNDKVIQIPINWESLTDAQLQAIADGRDPLDVLAGG